MSSLYEKNVDKTIIVLDGEQPTIVVDTERKLEGEPVQKGVAQKILTENLQDNTRLAVMEKDNTATTAKPDVPTPKAASTTTPVAYEVSISEILVFGAAHLNNLIARLYRAYPSKEQSTRQRES
jgi:hypothetical protein